MAQKNRKNNFQLQSQLDDLYEKQSRKLACKAKSIKEFKLWQNDLRHRLLKLLGLGHRAYRNKIKSTKIKTLDRGLYLEEKHALMIDKNVACPIFLLIPKTKGPFKPILAFHGHTPGAQYILGNYPNKQIAKKMISQDNNYAQRLAQAGYLVCALEQRGMGERRTDDDFTGNQADAPAPRSCRQLFFSYLMQGKNLIGERCYDAISAINWLRQRKDLIKGVLGCTGHSGGATTALYLSVIDKRVTAAILAGGFSSFKESILARWHCWCNYIPEILNLAEMGDIATLIAPRPLRIIAGKKDPLFPLNGAREQFKIIERCYTLLKEKNKCSLAVHAKAHVYNHNLALEWFNKWL